MLILGKKLFVGNKLIANERAPLRCLSCLWWLRVLSKMVMNDIC